MQIYVDGSFQSLDRAVLVARDIGFLYGVAAYEGIKVVDRRPLFLDAHLDRLDHSVNALEIPLAWDRGEVRDVLSRLLDEREERTSIARLYVTGGSPGTNPTRLAWLQPLPAHSHPDTPPLHVVCHPEAITPYRPQVKHTNRLPHFEARRCARSRGADDGLLVHVDGSVLEGAQSNLFFFDGEVLHTPAIDCGVLGGITRDFVLSLARRSGVEVREGRYTLDTVLSADEWFLTFTSAGVKPVAQIDTASRPAPGPKTARLREAHDIEVTRILDETPPL